MRAKPVPPNTLLAEKESTTTIPQRKGEKMETNPHDYGEQCRFNAFCKTVLKKKAIVEALGREVKQQELHWTRA